MAMTKRAVFSSALKGIVAMAGLWAATASSAAFAAAGRPTNWGMGLQDAASPTAVEIDKLHDILIWVCVLITLFVLGLLIYVVLRFNAKANPVPSRTTHNTLIEVLWTGIPVLILVLLAIPSFKLLYFADSIEDADLTIKATGRQWYWVYEIPEQEYKGQKIGGFEFESRMKPVGELGPDDIRLLSVDAPLALPVSAKVRVLVTGGADDVLHNFAMPSLGLKLDAVPGRLNETWTLINPEYDGTRFFGQCSELCGKDHAYMPIEIRAVDDAKFFEWAAKAKAEYAEVDETPAKPATTRLAAVSN
jgi:cytochrome c oxidase subunit 2